MAIRELKDNTNFPDTYKEFSGLSTDSKPTTGNGTITAVDA